MHNSSGLCLSHRVATHLDFSEQAADLRGKPCRVIILVLALIPVSLARARSLCSHECWDPFF